MAIGGSDVAPVRRKAHPVHAAACDRAPSGRVESARPSQMHAALGPSVAVSELEGRRTRGGGGDTCG